MTKKDRKTGDRIPTDDIEEVSEFLDIKQELERFKTEYPEVFRALVDLTDRYNTALDAAEKAVRAKGVSCGPFHNYSTRIIYDATAMYDELGEEDFLANGGKITRKTVYEVDPILVSAAIAGGKVPEECIEHFRKTSHSYRKVQKLKI